MTVQTPARTAAAAAPAHWAADLVGMPYCRAGTSPGAFNCWGLVREACRRRHGLAMPTLEQGAAHAVAAAQGLGWHPVGPALVQLRDGDILRMRTERREPHVAFAVGLGRAVELLHAVEGGVIVQPPGELGLYGFHDFMVWRLQP